MNEQRPRPRAFRLDDARIAVDDAPAPPAPAAYVKSEDNVFDAPPQEAPLDAGEMDIEAAQAAGVARRRRFSLGKLLLSGLGGLVSLALGLWTSEFIDSLFTRAAALGWIAVGLLALSALALVALLAREALALRRQAGIADLHAALARARATDDRDEARRRVAQLIELYRDRPGTARARSQVSEALGAIVDGRDLIDLAERALLRPLDAEAQAQIAAAAKTVSLMTALSPRAILDVIFVLWQVARLSRRIAEIYGGRPGLLGFFRLMRSIGAHLAITGGMAVGDSLLQQLVGHGIASRISQRMGEGVLNGLLTARVGLAALGVCRPAPFGVVTPPGVGDVAPFLFRGGKGA